MCKRTRTHASDEFGRPGSGSATIGIDGPIIGAAAAITVDGIVERESGATPPPPPFSIRTAVITLVAVFALGVIALTVLTSVLPKSPVYDGATEMLDQRLEQARRANGE